MYRATSLYAIFGITMLALGLVATRLVGMQGVSITWRNTGHVFPYQVFCYGLGAFFCVYAFLTSIWAIPFGALLARWHFWLSAGSVVLLVGGFASIVAYMAQHPTETRVGPAMLVAIGSVLTGLLVFAMAQVWFAVGFVRALWRMRGAA